MGSVLWLGGACRQEEPAIVTQVVEEVVSKSVEVTRVVTNEVFVPLPTSMPPVDKELVVCLPAEPETLYIKELNERNMPAMQPILHGIYENNITNLSFEYQAQGVEKVPAFADGDLWLQSVTVQEGMWVVDRYDQVIPLQMGSEIQTAQGEDIVFSGEPVTMNQMMMTFTLKPRVWSDGTPVTAFDSVYSFQLDGDPNTPRNKYLVERTELYTATSELEVQWVGLPGYMDQIPFDNFAPPVPAHLWQAYTPLDLRSLPKGEIDFLVGDGPFVLAEWKVGEYIRLEKNPYYYQPDFPSVDRVIFRFISNPNRAFSDLLSGHCHILTQHTVAIEQSPDLINAERQNLLQTHFQVGRVYEQIILGIDSYGRYDLQRPDWFEDKRVRQAMALCTNREQMVDTILFGKSQVAHGFLSPNHPLYQADLGWSYDPVRGNQLLDEVGLTDRDGDGIREFYDSNPRWRKTAFQVTLLVESGLSVKQSMAELFRDDMRQCGIDVEFSFVPAKTLYANISPLLERAFDMSTFAWAAETIPACQLHTTEEIIGPIAEGFCGWEGCINMSGFSHADFDRACAEIHHSVLTTTQQEEAVEALQRVYTEEMPALPLFWRIKVAVTRPEVLHFDLDTTQPSELWNLFALDLTS